MRCLLFTLALLLLVVQVAAAETYAEKLGYPAGSRVLLVHCDDVGMCLSSTEGAIDGLEHGIVSSCSVMTACPWAGRAAQYLREHPQVDAGVHLAMTSEWDYYRWGPVAGKSAVPGLADQWGCLWDSVSLVTQHASADEIEREIRAQVDRALAFGFQPTHIDTHMGTLVARPDYVQRYYKVGIEKGLAVMAFANTEEELPSELQAVYQGLLKQVWNAGLPILDHIITNNYEWKADETRDGYLKLLPQLKPGVTEIIVHCAMPSVEIYEIQGDSAASRWIADRRAMTDPQVKQLLKDQGIILTTWRELKERRARFGKPM